MKREQTDWYDVRQVDDYRLHLTNLLSIPNSIDEIKAMIDKANAGKEKPIRYYITCVENYTYIGDNGELMKIEKIEAPICIYPD